MERKKIVRFLGDLTISIVMLTLAYKIGDEISRGLKNKNGKRGKSDE